VVPVADDAGAAWGDTHASYPATDIFSGGCGGTIVSPVTGTLLEVRRVNTYDPALDNPATRGGRSISILGDDGVRYYLAHFDGIEEGLEPDVRVAAGQPLGTVGTTGRSSACHVHFGISPPCPEMEWSVRRGAVWPWRYLDDWRNGGQASPAAEVAGFSAENPTACADAASDPFASDA
jgi:murein DD-endopeptidase MepM/ murein hydrolase activator NlpD